MFKFKKQIFLFSIIFSFFLFNISTYAQTSLNYTPLAAIPSPSGTGNVGSTDLATYFSQMYQLGVGVATALAVLMVIWGGVEYITTDAIGGKEEGKQKIQNAILGLLLALGSYLILQTINPALLNTNLNITPVTTKGSSAPAVSSATLGGNTDAWANWNDKDQENFNAAYAAMNSGTLFNDLTADQQAAIYKEQLDQSAQNVYNTPSLNVFSSGSIAKDSLSGLTFPPSSGVTNDQVLNMINQSGILNGPIPSDAAQFFPGGVPTAQGYANLLASIAKSESGFNPNDNIVAQKKDGSSSFVSEGLFSLSNNDPAVVALARQQGVPISINSAGQPIVPDSFLANPQNNTQASINILKNQIQNSKSITGGSNTGYWGPLRRGE